MREALVRWRQTLNAIAARWRPLTIFQIWFALVTGVLLTPVSTWVLHKIVESSGHVAISNYDLVEFFLSIRGLFFVTWLCVALFAILLAEVAGLFLLCAASRTSNTTPTYVLWRTLRMIPNLARLGWWIGAALAVLAVPFLLLGAGAASALLGKYDINYYLYHEPLEWWTALAVGGFLALTYAVIAAAIGLRVIFALPLLLFERQSPRAALRRSWELTRHKALDALYAVGGWWALISLIAALLALTVTSLGSWLLSAVGEQLTLSLVVIGGTASLLLAIGVVWASVAKSGGAMLTVELFEAAGGRIPGDITEPESATGFVRSPPSSRIVGATLGLVFFVVLVVAAVDLFSIRIGETFDVTAHRAGAIHAPENTLAALRRAIDDKADYAEIDVQTTRDGAVVVIHDGDMKRVAGDPRAVADLTRADLKMLDVGSWHDPVFFAERVPLLTEMIALARNHIKLNIELKYNRSDPTLVVKLVEILRAENFMDQCIITSLNMASLIEMKTLAPDLITGLIVTQAIGDPARIPTDFLAVNQRLATDAFISRAEARGKPVHVWTVNNVRDMERVVERGSVNLITDRPAEAVALRTEREQMSVPERLLLRLRRLLVE